MKSQIVLLSFILSLATINTNFNDYTSYLKSSIKNIEKPFKDIFNKFDKNTYEVQNSDKVLKSKYNPAGQILTNEPIIGILTQPYVDKAESATLYSTSFDGTIIPSTHVEFLSAAGARIVPLNYKLRPNALGKILQQINGVYIPGDQDFNLKNAKYMDAVDTIMEYALEQQIRTKQHFPVMTIGYGFIASLISMEVKDSYIQKVTSDLINDIQELTFFGNPFNSYIFDGHTLDSVTKKYDDLLFLNELSQGILLKNFQKDKKISKHLNPIAVYYQPRKQIENEFVAIAEGKTIPYFGLAFSIDLIQTNMDITLQTRLEVPGKNKEIITEAQRIANVFVDEARFNGNKFTRAKEEQALMIDNYLDDLMMINMASPSGDFTKYFAMAYVLTD